MGCPANDNGIGQGPPPLTGADGISFKAMAWGIGLSLIIWAALIAGVRWLFLWLVTRSDQ